MAPTRKSKSVNKQYLSRYEVSPDKSPGNSRKSKPKKLTDKLGSQWSNAEIERFYKAYREYGKDWKKVAAAVHNRSAEMVEALYCLNRAYLSLPDGTASVIGLIAMMTDHYNVLGGSDGERESNKPSDTPRKAQKRKQARVHLDSSKEDVQPRSIASSEGCLSLLKRAGLNGIFPHACRKRTPRVLVSYSYRKDDTEIFIPPTKRVKKSEVDDEDDEHVAAWTLTGTLQKGGSPHTSHSPYKRAEHQRSSPLRRYDRMLPQPQSETTEAKLRDSSYECRIKGRPGEMELVSGTYARDTDSLMDVDGTDTVEVHRKGKNFYRKKIEVKEMKSNLSDDSGEACSGTKGIIDNALRGKLVMEISSAEKKLSPCSERKRIKELVFEDQSSSLDALLTLANLSTSMLPTSITESESSVKMKEDRITFEADDQSSVLEAASISHHRDKIKQRGPNKKVLNLLNGSEGTTSRKSTVGRYSAKYGGVISEPKQQKESTNNSRKRKQKSSCPKLQVLNAEAPPMDSHLRKCSNNEEMAKEEKKYLNKGKSGAQQTLFRVPAESVTNNDPKVAGIDSVVPTSQVAASNSISLSTKHQSRRKMNLKRALFSTNKNLSACSLENQPNGHSLPQETLKQRLSSCISSNLARRWCCFEWFYSPIDYAWFAKREFVEYLNHVSLDHIPRLTRVEWGVIRSSLGKPRRLSERFLFEEREKLKQYRESVRQHYTRLRLGTREGLATDLAPPLSVGQRVIAIHPKTREVDDGKVLSVDHDRCRVQFDILDLGVEFVMDIDCMPINSLENMPETLKRQNIAFDKSSLAPRGSQGNGNLELGGSKAFTSSGCMENAMGPVNMLATPIKVDVKHSALHGKPAVSNVVSAHQAAYGHPLTMAHIQGRETDIQVMSELSHALHKKEALLTELRHTNNDVSEIQNGEGCLKGSEHFKEHVTTLLVHLKEASAQASSALLNLRQRNTYPANPLLPWQKPPTNLDFFSSFTSCTLDSSLIAQEVGSVVGDIVNGSRLKAYALVDVAIKAVSSMKEGEDAFMRVGEALHSLDKKQFTSDITMPTIKLPEHNQANGSIFIPSKPMPNSSISGKNEEQVPSELITSCVATLLMIQRCTERQFPPADVAQVIDSAIASLHPCCPQNLPIYREIQMCMGKIKTQILALIPSLV
ncbi:protein ALWAYS EARLY 2-like isoform X2 [Hibiscus syriacus]|uniref:protein ALWAYS EARLY 2-like isoform X2 n=1 Tax=Hibiscus syriacus TaxID=106335 RepID=UPI0019227A53|nr:protein ALWAYS EARLY 2-like isoform X2 [Hibiscus syriacus]